MVSDEVQPLLSEATFEDLAEELGRRYPIAVLAIISDPGEAKETFRYRTVGTKFGAIGLCALIRTELTEQIIDVPNEDDPEDLK